MLQSQEVNHQTEYGCINRATHT